MSYKIGSFNVRNLSLSPERDLDRIAAIINEHELDIVAMQEVLGEGKILTGIGLNNISGQARAYDRSLRRRLKGNWDICWCDPKTQAKNYPYLGEDVRGEGYAFLWNTDKFELPTDERGAIRPRIWRNYKLSNREGLIRLMRDPCYGRFKIKNLKVEIRLITTHIVYRKPNNENISLALDVGATNMRRNEFKILAGDIYRRISEHRKDINCTVPYTIILGDYNMNLRSSGVGKALLADIVSFDDQGNMHEGLVGPRMIYNNQKERSTLRSAEPGYANNYDHFSYDQRVKDNIVKSVYVIDAVHEHTKPEDQTEEAKFATYKKTVSDHIPIVVEIDFK